MEKKKMDEEKIKKVTVIEDDSDYEEEEEKLTVEERIVNIEKKVKVSFWLNIISTVLIVFLLLMLLGGGNASLDSTDDGTTTESGSGYDISAFNQIYPEDISSLSNDNIIVVWIGYQECGYCQAYAPLLTQVTKEYGIKANYIDLTTVTEEQVNKVMALKGKGEWADFAASFTGTPFTLIIKNNKVVGGISGYTEAENIAAAFEKAGIKKK